jgi:hypothetical protein
MNTKCVFIRELTKKDVVCRKKAAGEWRVYACSPIDTRQHAFMLVPLCRKHGSMKRRRK